MIYREIGRNVRDLRKRKKLTQEQLAEAADISPSFMGHIERGTRKLSVDTLYKIARELDCSVDELLGINVDYDKKKQSAREILHHVLYMLDENE